MKMLCTEYGITILISSHIPFEIENITDTIGVIEHGILKKEVTIRIFCVWGMSNGQLY